MDFQDASLSRRLAAIVYDGLVLIGLWFVATALILPFNAGQAVDPKQWLFAAYLVSVSFVFFAWFWTHGGQTLGMRAWNLRVVNLAGDTITWSQALIRFAASLLSWAALGLGFWWIAFSRKHRSWHDLWSRTRVVRIG